MRIFHKAEDFAAFERVLAEGLERYPVALFTYCLMPNHWHLVVRPKTDQALGQWMRWVGVTHVRRYHEHYHSRGGGHVYQGRFKSFPVAEDDYFLALCRYVEANPLRAGLVKRAEHWQWSGLWRRAQRSGGDGELRLCSWPVERPRNWIARGNRDLNDEQMEMMRTCVQRDRPLGPETWVGKTASRLGLEYTLRGPGRPKTKSINQ
jgi:putative transposase